MRQAARLGVNDLKPEISATLFLPIVAQLKECDVAIADLTTTAREAKPTPLEKRPWIDERTFRELIGRLIEAGQQRRLTLVGEQLLNDESAGLGELLLPFLESPHTLLETLVVLINQQARTLRVSIKEIEEFACEIHFTTSSKSGGRPVLGAWAAGLFEAAQIVPWTATMVFDEAVHEFGVRNGRDTSGKASDEYVPCCTFEIRWKKSAKRALRKRNKNVLEQAKSSTGKARQLLLQQRQSLNQMHLRLAQQDELLHGIVSVSEATKAVKTYRDLIHLTADRICTHFGFDRSMIYLAREGKLDIVSVIDPLDRPWAQTIFAACQANPIPLDGHSEEGKAYDTAKPVVVNNPWNNIFVPQAQQESWKSKGYLIVPIRGAGRIIGLMLADHYYKRQPIETDDVDRLQVVANISGMAMEKLRLIDRLEAKVSERTSELERANKKLMQLYSRARESDRLKSDFLANMSHELRTPLNSIIGFSKLILRGIDGELTSKQETDITAILNSGTHLLSLINDILDLSKIESGRMDLKMEVFPIVDLIDSVATTAEGLIKEKPITLETKLDPQIRFLYGDHVRLRQVLINLVSNAVKFTETGKITITTRAGGDEVYIAVTDTGVGMPSEKLELAFERFRQLESGTSRPRGGSGLGLTISKKFVEMHNGRIWITSTEGVGSTFHIALPLKAGMAVGGGTDSVGAKS